MSPAGPVNITGTAAGIAASAAVAHTSLAPVRSYLAAVQNLEFRIGDNAAERLERELMARIAKDRAGGVASFHTSLTVRYPCPGYAGSPLDGPSRTASGGVATGAVTFVIAHHDVRTHA